MSKVFYKTMETRKVGAEDIIMMNLPTERFRDSFPSHYTPPVNDKSHYQVALLAQVCKSNSFDNHETGGTDEIHLWLQFASSNTGKYINGAEVMLPTMHWLALACATRNITARKYLQKFGFSPQNLHKIELQQHGGTLTFPDGGQIDWTIKSPGKALPKVGINHVIFVAENRPNASGHHVAALLSDTFMQQPGSINIQTAALEPFLLKGERISAVVNRVSDLKATVVWHEYPK